MLVLIDESGCAGFKLGKGSTPRFVIGMVIFHDYGEAERASRAIGEARMALRVKPEFKFSKCSDWARDGFFRAVDAHAFQVRALVIDKAKIYSSHLRLNSDGFYNYFVKQLISRAGITLVDANVKIDGSGDREFKRALSVYLRREVGPGKIAKLRFTNSRQDNLIQLADMATGAIARSYSGRADANRWRSMLAPKIANVWEFQ
jgi:hypothetical protein